jgi:hypothetical protein
LAAWRAALADFSSSTGPRLSLIPWPAFIPVTFELTILGAALSAVLGMLALNKLPQPHHPVFNVPRFTHASADRFFICIEARDPKFHIAEAARILQELHAHHVVEVSDD